MPAADGSFATVTAMKNLLSVAVFPPAERVVKVVRSGLLGLAQGILFGGHGSTGPTPRRILVFRISAVGDFVLAVPALNLLRRAFPGAEVLLVTAPSSNPKVRGASAKYNATAESCPWVKFVWPSRVDRVVTLDSFSYPYLREQVAPVVKLFEPDAAFILPQQDGGTIRSQLSKLLLLRAIGVRCRVFGWRSGSGPLFRGWHFKTGKVEHAVQAPLNAVREHPLAAQVPGSEVSFNLDIPAEDVAWADALGHERRWGTRCIVAVSISAVHEHKQWGKDKFTELSRRLLADTSVDLVILGTKGMQDEGERIAALNPDRITNLCGMTTITQMAAILKHCAVLVGNDGGAMHIGAAVGCKCVAIMPGLEYAGSIEPWGNIGTAVRHPIECSPCYSFTSCPRGHMKCMRLIEVEQVLAVCGALVRKAGPAGSR
jgi:ADP-heptose:LPS heptosyltransferase